MEEKKPLDSQLTHTSKEPEAQLWAQIGTSSYSPLPSNDKAATTKPSKEEPQSPSKENGTPTETPEAKNDSVGDSGNKDAESKPAESDEKGNTSDEVPKSKSSTLGDGFTDSDADATKDSGSKERSRSRSRSRERRRRLLPDYTTNSSNPNDIKSRVFVGHLNTEKCTKEEVGNLFEPYGTIIGVNLRDGYGFVQFKDESSVKEAIKHVHAKMFHDMKLGWLSE